jgi:hypothetical protein
MRRRRAAPDVGAPPHPVVSHYWPDLGATDRIRIGELAGRIRQREPHLEEVVQFGGVVAKGCGDFPTVHLHDGSPTIHVGAPRAREHRAFLLARRDDVVITGSPPVPGFVDHCRHDLALGGGVRCINPRDPPDHRSLALRCIQDESVRDRLRRLAGAFGGLNIAPYISTGGVWALAGIISSEAGVPVCVSAPPPRLAERVNSKVWFARIAADFLGFDALPLSTTAHGWTGLAHLVRDCANRCSSVGIKLPSDAGAAGNLVLDADDLGQFKTLRSLRDHLRTIFAGLGWSEPFPTLVSVWEDSVISSPSVQLWIPSDTRRAVVVEGIFDQKVEGSVCRFVGCEPSSLAEPLLARLAHEAALFGALFQELGYFGRCSLDAIVIGESLESARVHWVECNGRWGGTSIPMTLTNRLVGDWTARPMSVLGGLEVVGDNSFDAIRERTRNLVFRADTAEGLVFLSPGPAETGRGLDFMAVGASIDRARKLLSCGVSLLTREPTREVERFRSNQRRHVQAGSV